MGAQGDGEGSHGSKKVWGSEDGDDNLVGNENAADTEEGEANGGKGCGDVVRVDGCEGGGG